VGSTRPLWAVGQQRGCLYLSLEPDPAWQESFLHLLSSNALISLASLHRIPSTLLRIPTSQLEHCVDYLVVYSLHNFSHGNNIRHLRYPRLNGDLRRGAGINDFQPEVWPNLADFDNDFFDFDEYVNFDTSYDSNPQPSWVGDPSANFDSGVLDAPNPAGSSLMPLDINQHYALPFGRNEDLSTVHSVDLDTASSNIQSLSQFGVPSNDDISEDIFREQQSSLFSRSGTSFIRKHPRGQSSGPSNAAALPTTGNSRVPRPADDLSATTARQLITEATQELPLPESLTRSEANGAKRKSAAVPHGPDRSLTKRVRVDRSLQGLPQSQVHCFSVSIPVEADYGCNKRKGKPLTHTQRLTRKKGACLRCRVLKKPVILSYDTLFLLSELTQTYSANGTTRKVRVGSAHPCSHLVILT
jgi:hypothetical protein